MMDLETWYKLYGNRHRRAEEDPNEHLEASIMRTHGPSVPIRKASQISNKYLANLHDKHLLHDIVHLK